MLIAGRNLLLEKAVAASATFTVNDAAFAAAREAARQGERIMYRDTDQGVRYLVKQGDSAGRERSIDDARQGDGDRRARRSVVRVSAADFRHQLSRTSRSRGRTDTQFALLFGGVLAAGNLQRPKIGGTPLDASVDFFGIAVPASDRLYSADGEHPEEATPDLAAVGRRQSRVAIHGVSEGRVSISTALRSVRARSHDG